VVGALDDGTWHPGSWWERWTGRGRRSGWYLRLVLLGVALLALFVTLNSFYRRELYHYTGAASWMWTTSEVQTAQPTAGLFFHHLQLADRPLRAVAKVCGDRQYVLWINGLPALAGRNRPGFRLDVVQVGDLLDAGDNVIALEVRSPTSVGGVLFALDLEPSPEGRRAGDPRGRNVVVSGPDWRVTETWSGGVEAPPEEGSRPPWIWGRPPDHPWSYPSAVVHERPLVHSVVSDARVLEADDFVASGPGRWLCELAQPLVGFLWLDLEKRPRGMTIEVASRYPGDQQPPAHAAVVSLPGQRRWLFPGWVAGDRVVVSGTRPPARLELVEAVGRPD
jgi:hypothetical protein